ncbi:MAG TPA: thermonuclease family protein [Bdellovibrionota bacterium]|nr:thermonuclease family protein [Bdellovibrionota bacterium]
MVGILLVGTVAFILSLSRRKRVAPEPTIELFVKVLHIYDGDTILVKALSENLCVRFFAIDCPEGDQEWGDVATWKLQKLILNRFVKIETHGRDIYGRTLATLFLIDESESINVNEYMVKCGHAWVARKYYRPLSADRRRKLDKLETWARTNRVGLWKNKNAIPPWEHRHRQKRAS